MKEVQAIRPVVTFRALDLSTLLCSLENDMGDHRGQGLCSNVKYLVGVMYGGTYTLRSHAGRATDFQTEQKKIKQSFSFTQKTGNVQIASPCSRLKHEAPCKTPGTCQMSLMDTKEKNRHGTTG